MKRPALFVAIAVFFAASSFGQGSFGQGSMISPLRFPAGAVVDFQLQSRLAPSAADPADALPAGTALHVRLLKAIDSRIDSDGSEFQGVLVSPLEQNDHVIVPANAEAHGLLALLRSQRHPEGFRYELLVTSLVDEGKSYTVTASLDSSLFESKPPASQTSQNLQPTSAASN